ncbi:copper amine oxidase N-terminal domain-containing protein [Clostridium aminobutyricum]|uniref:Copper amine oxidase-like N-terminal domain-containing protein n=1 Tax=Clostridium aminobutyricum TaxID=33953 RepID=A0A939DAK6_CLOAM|nr:copper amine oxidase N-terminal domain-containing protein [Clostridium aminobutyricum]MBN7774201.1 hypothetical protein [Clostridium aminobutyricum]
MKKYIVVGITVFILLFCSTGAAASSTININMDGKNISFSQNTGSPFIDQYNRTLVPFRVTLESFGCQVTWDNSQKLAYAQKDGILVCVPIGQNNIWINGTSVENDTQAIIKDGRTYLPIRAVLEAFGASVEWDKTSQAVIVDSDGNWNQQRNLALSQDTDESYKAVSYQWEYPAGSIWSYELALSTPIYDRYKSMDRNRIIGYTYYVNDTYDDEFLNELAHVFKKTAEENNMSDWDMVNLMVCFVQSFEYTSDYETTGYDEYPKFPLETLYDRGGDCEDTSILLVSLLRQLGYGAVMLEYDDHMAVGIKGADNLKGTYYEQDGSRYYYIETTSTGWKIGKIPEEYAEKEVTVLHVD